MWDFGNHPPLEFAESVGEFEIQCVQALYDWLAGEIRSGEFGWVKRHEMRLNDGLHSSNKKPHISFRVGGAYNTDNALWDGYKVGLIYAHTDIGMFRACVRSGDRKFGMDTHQDFGMEHPECFPLMRDWLKAQFATVSRPKPLLHRVIKFLLG